MPIALAHLVSRIRSLPAIACLSLTVFAPAPELAAVSQPSQSEVEAVYLFDFGKFIRWPAGAVQGPMRICVAGAPTLSGGLEKVIAGESIGGRPLEVRRVAHAAEETGCAILFIDSTERSHADELLHAVADQPTLTVSDLPDFFARGGMVQFQLVEKRVRFSVNLDAVNRGHLIMSSELLKVAMAVKGRAQEGGVE